MMSNSSQIHILHVVPGLMPGGMELTMARVISELTDSGMRHSIACLKGTPEIADKLPESTDIFCFNAKPNELKLPFRLANLVKKLRPDVIHARNWGAWPDIALGRFFTSPLVPLIYSFHGLGVAGYMPWRRRMASKILVHMTSHLFTVSRQSRNMLLRHWGWPEMHTEIIPNGVDTDRFFPNKNQINTRIVIGSVGNLRTVKNHALIFKACAKLITAGVDIEVRIAGEGDQRKSLMLLAKSLGMVDRFHLPGRIDDVPQFLNDLDIFVLSSDSEQHPNALNEAMACGISSVSTNVGCVEDLLDGGRCGKIIKPGDEEGLINALYSLSEDRKLRENYAHAGMEHVRGNYSLRTMLQRYRELYIRAARKDRK